MEIFQLKGGKDASREAGGGVLMGHPIVDEGKTRPSGHRSRTRGSKSSVFLHSRAYQEVKNLNG
jgi:hypothetical protein